MVKQFWILAAALVVAAPSFAADHGKHKGGPEAEMCDEAGKCPMCGKRHGDKWQARMDEVLGKLPAEKAKLVRETFEGLKEGRKDGREAKMAAHADMKNAFAAETFDAAAFKAAHEKIAEARAARHKAHGEALAALAAKLTPAERAIVAELFERPARDGKGDRDGQGKPGKK